MSDVMLLGILRMPLENPDALTLLQFVATALSAADRIEADAAELERLRTALQQIRHATAPTPDDGGHHEAAHDLADAALKHCEDDQVRDGNGESAYLRTVAELQDLARRAPYVTHEWVLQVASMAPDDMRRRLIRSSDWHGHFVRCLDGIPEIRNMPGAGIDGCRTHKEVRAVVLGLLQQIEHLRAALSKANDQAERFERGWYLRGDVLEKLQAWANAYPLTVFPEPDLARAHELLKAGGMTLDAISASNMRHVIDGVRALVAEGLKS